MKPISVTYKNFLACGNNPITIKFDEHHLNLIVGNNGAGKSMFLDAITFALFGKSFREINKTEIINNDNNSDCVVEFVFEMRGKVYKVYRGIKPNIFQIFEDDVKINEEAEAKSQQLYLQNLIGIKYDAFKQIVVLGASNYIPFMKLKTGERRKFIEDILDMQVFAKMSEITRTEYKLLMERYNSNNEEIRLFENELTIRMGTLKNYTAKNAKDVDRFDAHISEVVTELQGKRTKLLEMDNKKHLDIQSNVRSQLSKMEAMMVRWSTERHADTTMLNFLEKNDNCPTCKQDISPDFKNDKVDSLKMSLDVVKDREIKGSAIISGLRNNDLDVKKEIQKYQDLESDIKNRMNYLKNYKAQKDNFLADMGNVSDITKEQTRINELNDKLTTLKTSRDIHEDEIKQYTQIISFLNDDGLKREVIKKYIPIVNTKVNDYLLQMNFFVDYTLDEQFNETIKARKRNKFSYNNFSEGERKRIDLALMFTWRDITNMVNQSNQVSLLVLDEIFDSSLDGNGVEDFLDIIRNMDGQNIFIISHRSDNMLEHFDNIIEFKKVDGFSEMVVD